MSVIGLNKVKARVIRAAERVGRDPGQIRLVVVTKGRAIDELNALYEVGHRDFGENRAQELSAKVARMPADVRWHFIGPLQTNKVRLVRPAVTMLHSLDRLSLAEAWMKGPGMPPPALLEVNIGEEPQKAGVAPPEVPATVDRMMELRVPLRGLMAIPPVGESGESSRRHFRAMAQLREQVRLRHGELTELSMGMTDDFEVAVEEGATVIRVGRAIFSTTD